MSLLSSSSAFRTYIGPSRKRASSSTYTSHKRGRGANRRSSIATSRRRTFSWIRTSARGCPTLGSRGSWTGDALGLTPVSWERGGERKKKKERKLWCFYAFGRCGGTCLILFLARPSVAVVCNLHLHFLGLLAPKFAMVISFCWRWLTLHRRPSLCFISFLKEWAAFASSPYVWLLHT